MAKECTGETTTGVLKSKEVMKFLNGVFECDRAKTSTKDTMFGCERDDRQGVRVRTQPKSFELKHDDASAP